MVLGRAKVWAQVPGVEVAENKRHSHVEGEQAGPVEVTQFAGRERGQYGPDETACKGDNYPHLHEMNGMDRIE